MNTFQQDGPSATANVRCPHCQQPVTMDMHFCPRCGALLAGQAGTPAHAQSNVSHAAPTTIEIIGSLPDIVKQIDQSASTNISITGVLIGFYSGAIFAGKVVSGAVVNAILYALPLCLLLVAIIFALRVLHPDIDVINEQALVQQKNRRLRMSSLYLQIAVGVLILAIFVYLIRPQP